MNKILIIEDDRDMSEILLLYLRKNGFECRQAFDGPAAVEMASAGQPDVVVLDVMLPGFDGLEVCRRIQAERPVPVLMLTARDDESDILVEAIDRKHLLKDISNLIAQEDVHVLSIQSDQHALSRVQLRLRLRVGDYGQLARLLGKLDSLPGVEQARRS